jgi:murein DD-endopeptidase MepM/ murein hydrolase activator NlpD
MLGPAPVHRSRRRVVVHRRRAHPPSSSVRTGTLLSMTRTHLAVLLVSALVLLPVSGAAAEPDPVGVWPLVPVPEVVHGFDPPDQPWEAGHRGVDLAGEAGQSVHTALPGTVRYAGRLAGRGVVVVSHGDTRTTYEPVHASVTLGADVRAGAVIGVLEHMGSHCVPRVCLHWGWLRGEVYLDPLSLVGALPVRLLPLTGSVPMALDERPSGPAVVPTLLPLPGAPWLSIALMLRSGLPLSTAG